MIRVLAASVLLQFPFARHVTGDTDTLAYYFPEINHDLTKVTWEHAVNSREKLDAALNGDALMLEADIVLGHTSAEAQSQNEPKLAVMAHPPDTVSNFTLAEFLDVFAKSGKNKGIKLDFKSREAFSYSLNLVDKFFNSYERDYPVWLNADIIPGPVNGSKNVVDPDYFLTTCISHYPTATISVGWSTSLAPGSTEGQYTQEDLDRMTEALNRYMVLTNPVTFAVRAAFAARSVDLLANLIATSSSSSTTLTVWSSVETDVVDIKGLKRLIDKVGRSKVYLDLPKPMTEKIEAEDSSAAPRQALPTIAFVTVISLFISLFL